jgi:hypothetical protein
LILSFWVCRFIWLDFFGLKSKKKKTPKFNLEKRKTRKNPQRNKPNFHFKNLEEGLGSCKVNAKLSEFLNNINYLLWYYLCGDDLLQILLLDDTCQTVVNGLY